MSRKRLYVLLLIACTGGYIWLFANYYFGVEDSPTVCLFKQATNIPCPSCGSTRSVLSLMKGDISGAVYWNPIGIILVLIMFAAPVWILFDIVYKKSTLLNFYHRVEMLFRNKWIAGIGVLLIISNWIWNISKGL